eukprot:CAMPEP_0113960306 /NCGR_PEP_ID=MMETSP0011_2-20120614/4637_1 /TAXON_ID=101924 /ORGANISM="Rhodosorus marinus" /LENGTH=297 /DNA_ID=CAMNT_0000971735 /DNA_START=88 /DNA_END=978 /DNA_ORIENTATION=+ /assembly_acc=CAM_ASM_000156
MESGFVVAGFALKGSTKLKACSFDTERGRFRVLKRQKRKATVTSLVCFSPLPSVAAPRRLIAFVSVLVAIVAAIVGLVARRMRNNLRRDAKRLICESSESEDGRSAFDSTVQLQSKISDEIIEDKNILTKVLLETQDKAKSADLKVQVLKEELQLKQKELDDAKILLHKLDQDGRTLEHELKMRQVNKARLIQWLEEKLVENARVLENVGEELEEAKLVQSEAADVLINMTYELDQLEEMVAERENRLNRLKQGDNEVHAEIGSLRVLRKEQNRILQKVQDLTHRYPHLEETFSKEW